jgi:ABC-type multidrug transport system fused ATPase/permease subunit
MAETSAIVVVDGSSQRPPDPETLPTRNPATKYLRFVGASWLVPTMKGARNKGYLDPTDLAHPQRLQANICGSQFETAWHSEQQRITRITPKITSKGKPAPNASLLRVLFAIAKSDFIVASIAALFSALVTFLPTYALRELLKWLALQSIPMLAGPVEEGLQWVLLMFVASFANAQLNGIFAQSSARISIKLQAALIDRINSKLLILRESTRAGLSSGSIVNVCFTDIARLSRLFNMLPQLVSDPLVLVISLYYLMQILGTSALWGIVLFVCTGPLFGILGGLMMKFSRKKMAASDSRVKIVSQLLAGIKVVKLAAAESTMMRRVNEFRLREVSVIRKLFAVRSTFMGVMISLRYFISAAVFTSYTQRGNSLIASDVYTALSLLGTIQNPLMHIPMLMTFWADASVSLDRLAAVLNLPEHTPAQHRTDVPAAAGQDAIVIKGSWRWAAETDTVPPALQADKILSSGKKGRKGRKGRKPKAGKRNKTSRPDELAPDVDTPAGAAEGDIPLADASPVPAIEVAAEPERNASFFPVLHDLNLSIPHGALVGVSGIVGSGKSSLMSAIIGELQTVDDSPSSTELRGRVSYCPQSAFILNDTLRGNVTFGRPFDRAKYDAVVEACCLRPDFDQLAGGDMTEIGERGVTLSGGQKARVSLARAVYAEAHVVLLDDPLSAVDAHVGRALWENVIGPNGVLRASGATVVIATHQVQFLPDVDRLLVLDDGRVVADGTFGDIAATNRFAELSSVARSENATPAISRAASLGAVSGESPAAVPKPPMVEDDGAAAAEGKQSVEETRLKGSVPLSTYMKWFLSANSIGSLLGIFVLFGLLEFAMISADFWLTAWTESGGSGTGTFFNWTVSHTAIEYSLWLFAIAFVTLLTTWFVNFVMFLVGLRSSTALANSTLFRILRCPMRFFDVTPAGRVLNVMSKDLNALDTVFPATLSSFILQVVAIIGMFLSQIIVMSWMVLIIIPLLGIYFRILQTFRVGARELRRLDTVTKAPVISLTGEILNGLGTIRAFGHIQRFSGIAQERLNGNTAASWPATASSGYVQYRVLMITSTIQALAALLMVYKPDIVESPSKAGLLLSFTSSLSFLMSFAIQLMLQMEMDAVSVERMLHYGSQLPEEAAVETLADKSVAPIWPSAGKVEASDLVLKYAPDLPQALDGVSFSIPPGAKVGVVGRTGAGKSTIMASLFRLTELTEGAITVDGVNVSEIGLRKLRNSLAVVPQDAFLISGTLRENLTFGIDREVSDADLWDILDAVRLRGFAENGGGLSCEISENGGNLSAGQRQLVCLARSLLKRSRLVLFDEVSANLDGETDEIIQRAILACFNESTVITVAHRLGTIIGYDYILVLERGKVAEFGRPHALLQNPDGIFTALVSETGPEQAANLHRAALAAHEKIQKAE